MTEQWKAVPIYPYSQKYEVSNLGRVRNSKTGRIMKHQSTKNGYQLVGLRNRSGNRIRPTVHRLVARVFLGEPIDERNEVNHIDGVKTNNQVLNLEWVTRKENMSHALSNGLLFITPETRKQMVASRKLTYIKRRTSSIMSQVLVPEVLNRYKISST